MGEYSCELCRNANRVPKVRSVTVSALIDGFLVSVPNTPICFNHTCVESRGGSVTMNATGPQRL